MNQFGDLTADEFKTRYTSEMSLAFDDYSAVLKEKAAFDVAAPASFDWRMVGGVTPVQNQGSCGCDYAFAAAGAIEGAHFVKFRQQVDVSEQNLVDCTYGGAYGNNGCGGGWASTCYKYVQANGVMAENEYRYEGRVGSCRHNTARPAASVSKYTMIPKGNENAIKDALFTNGPISVAFNSGTYAFAAYQSGILDVANCGNTPTLQVLIVGYGTENGKDFWIVKNSWGGGWGEKGYFRLVRGKNMCGIADWASYPTA